MIDLSQATIIEVDIKDESSFKIAYDGPKKLTAVAKAAVDEMVHSHIRSIVKNKKRKLSQGR